MIEINNYLGKVLRGIGIILIACITGCSLGPLHLHDSHLAYNQSVERVQSEELLLNIVRLRYSDGVEFLFVDSIAAQFSMNVGSNSSLGISQHLPTLLAQPSINYSDSPTITFSPRTDEKFVEQLTKPLPVPMLVSLLSMHPQFSKLVRLAVITLNGRFTGPDERLSLSSETLDLFSQLEGEGRILMGFVNESKKLSGPAPASSINGEAFIKAYESGLRFDVGPDKDTLQLFGDVAKPTLYVIDRNEESDKLMRSLGLTVGLDSYGIQSHGSSTVNDVLNMQTRSVIGIMHHLSRGVEVPASHLRSGLAVPVNKIGQQFRVHVSVIRPLEPCLAVRHRGYWYYVLDKDQESKQTFALLRAIYKIQLAGNANRSGPLLTLPLD